MEEFMNNVEVVGDVTTGPPSTSGVLRLPVSMTVEGNSVTR
jgi:hypothetical protein